jgi:hypothetical protein
MSEEELEKIMKEASKREDPGIIIPGKVES